MPGGLHVTFRSAGRLLALRSLLLAMIPGCRASPFSSFRVSRNAVLGNMGNMHGSFASWAFPSNCLLLLPYCCERQLYQTLSMQDLVLGSLFQLRH